MKKQEYTEHSKASYKGYDYTILELKYPVAGRGIISEKGIDKYEIYIEKDGIPKANIFLSGANQGAALDEVAKHSIAGLIIDEAP